MVYLVHFLLLVHVGPVAAGKVFIAPALGKARINCDYCGWHYDW